MNQEKRTEQQNKALHKWFQQVAEALRENHIDVRTALKEDVELEWTAPLVKEILWRTTQKLVTNKQSTTELDKSQEINLIYDIINRFLAKHKIHVPFPSLTHEEEPPRRSPGT